MKWNTLFLHVLQKIMSKIHWNLKKKSLQNQPASFNQTWYKSSLSEHFFKRAKFSSIFQHVLNRWHLCCVINSSHTIRLTFFKPCTVVLDTLKMCMWLFESVKTIFENFTCSWIKVIFPPCFEYRWHLLRWHLLCVIISSHTFKLTFFKPCTVVMDTLKMCMWFFWKCMDTIWKIYNLVIFSAWFAYRRYLLCNQFLSHL
jgi:hypothetical protein